MGPKIRQYRTLLGCLILELNLTQTVFKALLVKTADRLNQISSSKCQARRLESHQLPAQQTRVCAEQLYEGNPGHAWLLGAGCSTFSTGSCEVHEETTELGDPEEESLRGLSSTTTAHQGPRVTDAAKDVPEQPGFAGPQQNSCSSQGREGKHFHWQMKHFHWQMLQASSRQACNLNLQRLPETVFSLRS